MAGSRFQHLRTFEHVVALAVKPVDGVTGRPLGRAASVSVDGVHAEPIHTPSDYYVYLADEADFSGESVSVAVEAGREYVDATYSVPLPQDGNGGDVGPAVAVLRVAPSDEYLFGPDATLVVGEVEDGGARVPNAVVTLERTALETRTGPDGEFVLPIRGLVRLEDAGSEPLRFDPEDDTDPHGNPKPITVSVWDQQTEYDPTIRAERGSKSATRTVTIPVDERTELGTPLALS